MQEPLQLFGEARCCRHEVASARRHDALPVQCGGQGIADAFDPGCVTAGRHKRRNPGTYEDVECGAGLAGRATPVRTTYAAGHRFTDPEGAAFCVWEARKHRGAQVVNDPGSLNFNGLNTRDIEGAKAFYGSVFGWRTFAMDGGLEMWALDGYGDFIERHHSNLRKRWAEAGAPPGFEDVVATDTFPRSMFTRTLVTGPIGLAAEILVLRREPARGEGRALRVDQDRHPDPGRVERRDEHRSAELGGRRGRGVRVVDGERHASMRRRVALVVPDSVDRRWALSLAGMLEETGILGGVARRQPDVLTGEQGRPNPRRRQEPHPRS